MIDDIQQSRFERARERALSNKSLIKGIGTLSEKTLHMTLKYFAEPDSLLHEQKKGRYIADIYKKDCGEIIEIQTRNLGALSPKLSEFLKETNVTVIYPLISKKVILWLDALGNVKEQRKSPKILKLQDCFPEIYYIRQYLIHPNFTLRLMLLDVEDYRRLSARGKRGAAKLDIVPVSLIDTVDLKTPDDYARFLPHDLSGGFTSEDYRKSIGMSADTAGYALNVLSYVGLIKKVGKQGRFNLWQIEN